MLEFLEQFLAIFPEMRMAPLFIVGESYAGKYVPALGIQIHRHNENKTKEPINLRVCVLGTLCFIVRNLDKASKLQGHTARLAHMICF